VSSRAREIALKVQGLRSEVPAHVKLVAVTKYSPIEDVVAAYQAGLRDFGENRVDDLLAKSAALHEQGLSDVRWHFIGHLQSNKIAKLAKIKNLVAIHSVDTKALLEHLLKREDSFLSEKIALYLEVNTSGESEKAGFVSKEELLQGLDQLSDHHGRFYLAGLMTMATIRTDKQLEDARVCFRKLADLRQELLPQPLLLSMGMSQDWKVAVEEGSDLIRVGSSLFR
jgi:hypothetical protein